MGEEMATQVITTTQFSEQKLIRAGQRGDAQAIETLFRRYQRQLFQTALRVLGNAEDAEEALQDTFLNVYQHLCEFRRDSRFTTWLTRIAINAALQKIRRRHETVSLDDPGRAPNRVLPTAL